MIYKYIILYVEHLPDFDWVLKGNGRTKEDCKSSVVTNLKYKNHIGNQWYAICGRDLEVRNRRIVVFTIITCAFLWFTTGLLKVNKKKRFEIFFFFLMNDF